MSPERWRSALERQGEKEDGRRRLEKRGRGDGCGVVIVWE